MTSKQSPWQNRPSVISYWEHSFSGFDLSFLEILNLNNLMTKDNLVVHGGLGVCVPRACRITRVCVSFASVEARTDPIDMWIESSTDCGVTFIQSSDSHPVATAGIDPLVPICTCFKPKTLLNECEVWRPSFAIPPVGLGFDVPIFRIVVGLELR